MHGLGNDFIVLDARLSHGQITPDLASAMADRRFGIGCDQIMILRQPETGGDILLDMRNQDGSVTGACGNGTRCVAALLMAETGREAVTIETSAGHLYCQKKGDLIEVDMGPAIQQWDKIPLNAPHDVMQLDLSPQEPDIKAVALSMGNPHAVLFVDDAEAIDVAAKGAALTNHEIFPEGANISFASIISQNQIRMRVFERGVGITSACGSGACAVGVAAHLRGLTGRQTEIVLDGGSLFINWHDDGTAEGRVLMSGPVETVFEAALSGHLLALFEAANQEA